MITYNTGNPVPSGNAYDRFDNSQTFDEVVAGSNLTAQTRLGRTVKTLKGFEVDIANALATGVYVEIGDYAAGLVVSGYNQLFRYMGEFYRAEPTTSLPYTLTGVPATDLPLFVSVGDAALRTLLASSAGASNVFGKRDSLDAVAQSIQAYMANKVFVGQFGGFFNGVDDDGPAIRKAIDNIPMGVGGGIGFPDWGKSKIIGTVFVPQRIPTSGVAGQGVQLFGNNCTIIGDGVSNIFESGTGQYSTVSRGGATNWGLGDEQPTTIHYNSRIQGFNFQNCRNAIKVHNFIQGCAILDCYATNFTESMVWANRSFYLGQYNLIGRPFRNDRPDNMPIFRYEGFNNTMAFSGLHASGIGPDGFTHGYGYLFDGGVEAVTLTNGISAEAVKGGLVLKSIIYSMDVSMYFELCDTAILSIGANINHLNIDNSRFNACSTNLNVDNWLDGSFGAGNDTQNGITNFGSGSTCDIWFPSQRLTPASQSTWKRVPDNWIVPGGCKVHRNDAIFNADTGYSATLFALAADSSGGVSVVPRHYVGSTFNVGGTTPFCAIDTSVAGTCRWKTNIYWSNNLGRINFDLWVDHSQRDVFSGWTLPFNGIYAPVTVSGRTISVQQRGDYTDFVISGFGGISAVGGQIYI